MERKTTRNYGMTYDNTTVAAEESGAKVGPPGGSNRKKATKMGSHVGMSIRERTREETRRGRQEKDELVL